MRTDYCGSISRAHLGQTVTVFGWIHRRRDHGGVIFLDMRDRAGLLQVVCDPDYPAPFGIAEALRNEFVVRVSGKVRPRPEGTVNANLVSGEIEFHEQSLPGSGRLRSGTDCEAGGSEHLEPRLHGHAGRLVR